MATEAETKKKCAHEPCDCEVWPSRGVERDGRMYCCENCSQGKPCGHDGCSSGKG